MGVTQMRALRVIFFAAIVALSGDCGVLAASKPAQRPPCEGVDIRLPPARTREYAGLVAESVTTKVKPSQVSVHSFIASGPWSAVSASMPDSEDGFFFFKETHGRKQFKEVWGVGPILREGRRTHCLPMLVLAEAVSRNSHHRRNQATARIRAVNQIH